MKFVPTYRYAVSLALMVASVVLAGCAESLTAGKPQDAAYVAPPEKNRVVGDKELFPCRVGSVWTYDVLMTPIYGSPVQEVEQTRVVGRNNKGFIWERVQNNKVVSREIYAVNGKELNQFTFGPQKAPVRIEPPLPILRFPVVQGEVYPWSGKVVTPVAGLRGKGAVRVRNMEEVKTPLGKFQAVRIESILTIITPTKNQNIPSTAWYAPKIGIVQQRYIQNTDKGDITVVRILRSYKP